MNCLRCRMLACTDVERFEFCWAERRRMPFKKPPLCASPRPHPNKMPPHPTLPARLHPLIAT